MKHLRDRLYDWHVRLAHAFVSMSAEEVAAVDAWHSQTGLSDAEWPGWPSRIGPRPRLQPEIVSLGNRRLA